MGIYLKPVSYTHLWLPFDNMLIPTGIMEQQEQKKVNMLRMILKMLLINTRDVLNGLIVLEATNNMTSSCLLYTSKCFIPTKYPRPLGISS